MESIYIKSHKIHDRKISSYAAQHGVSCTVVSLPGEVDCELLGLSVLLLGVDDDGVQIIRSEYRLYHGQ